MTPLRTLAIIALLTPLTSAADPWVVYEGKEGVGKGKHVVLISGDEEYRSEEALPQMGKILATHHGFKCTVLFAVDPATGFINPNVNNNIPGLEALKTADLLVVFLRFRDLPPDQMKHIDDYLATGKPVVGLRTATHAFNNGGSKEYGKYHWQSKDSVWKEGFGRYILGETWINHHGKHGSQATRGMLAKEQAGHPILKGLQDGDVFGPSDVYTVRLPLPGDSIPLVFGQVVDGMKFADKAVVGPKNDPMMPVAWTKTYKADDKVGRVFTTTMGASQDLAFEGTRRLIVNACLWSLGLESHIPDKTRVDLVGEYNPTGFRFVKEWKGMVKPADLAK